jgi:hypothetical protein
MDYNMVKTFDPTLELPSEISGDLIKGGTITDFASTGIADKSTKQTLFVEDDKITVKTASIDTLDKGLTIKGDVKIYGILDAGFVRTTEIITNQRYEKQFLEFASPNGESAGTGFLWVGGGTNRQMVFKLNPDRFWLTEHIDIPGEKSYLIDGTPVLSLDSLGVNVVKSNLQSVGTLKNLTVSGDVNINDHIFYNPTSQRLSLGQEGGNGLFSVYDYNNNVEVIIDSSDNGYGKIGTHSTKGLELVTDDQARISISETGNVTVGSEYRDTTVTRIYGKVGIGVKNPTEQLEVAGNIKMGNRLFTNAIDAPSEGSYQKGDIIWNSNPRDGAYIGWVCTVTGAPGTWKPFGLIAP